MHEGTRPCFSTSAALLGTVASSMSWFAVQPRLGSFLTHTGRKRRGSAGCAGVALGAVAGELELVVLSAGFRVAGFDRSVHPSSLGVTGLTNRTRAWYSSNRRSAAS